ncbi:unnamed protein product [Brachionus calyciflorus]|uniref:Ceramide phosphoethanolamine synthase n=1 Tax=Brachionus calyciflorus TaxID=104777 RepID=A0A814IDG2_9BILA|nr:unnamed protein product [Brachionus calyciflorus]
MDIKLFKVAKHRGPYTPMKMTKNMTSKTSSSNDDELIINSVVPPKISYSVFRPLPVKKIMMAEATHYIRSPIAEFIEHGLGFSSIFPFVSANLVSITHCILSVVSIKFLMHDSLFWRQVGVCIFQFRNFLDSFDGVIFRAHANKTAYKSHYGSLGYFVDAVSDVFGGICLVGSIALYLMKNRPLNKNLTKCFRLADDISDNSSSSEKAALTRSSSSDNFIFGSNNYYKNNKSTNSKEAGLYATKITILISVALLGIRLAISALFWDRSVHAYEDLLDTPALSELHQNLQVNILKSTITLIIMFLWRIMNALSLQDMILTSIFIDKSWEFVVKSQYIGWFVLIFLIILTELHLAEIRSILIQAY